MAHGPSRKKKPSRATLSAASKEARAATASPASSTTPTHVLIELEFDRQNEAEAFRTGLQQLWGRVGDDLGLEGPQARIAEPVDAGEY